MQLLLTYTQFTHAHTRTHIHQRQNQLHVFEVAPIELKLLQTDLSVFDDYLIVKSYYNHTQSGVNTHFIKISVSNQCQTITFFFLLNGRAASNISFRLSLRLLARQYLIGKLRRIFFFTQTCRDSIRILCLFADVDVSSGRGFKELVGKWKMRV